MEPIIRVESVSKTYSTKSGEQINAIDSLTFDVKKGEFISVIGPSGCGKSTLLALIAGLEMPTYGRIILDGNMVTSPNPDKVSIVFQEHTLFPWRTLLGNVEFGLELKGVPKAEREERARKYLSLVGLEGFENKYPREVSGGMKQRASLARSLALEPEVILMDEPFGALDEQTRIVLGDELIRIWLATRKTIVFVTHSIQEAAYLSDRVIVLTKRPARIAKEIEISVPRPRNFADERLNIYKKIMLQELFGTKIT